MIYFNFISHEATKGSSPFALNLTVDSAVDGGNSDDEPFVECNSFLDTTAEHHLGKILTHDVTISIGASDELSMSSPPSVSSNEQNISQTPENREKEEQQPPLPMIDDVEQIENNVDNAEVITPIDSIPPPSQNQQELPNSLDIPATVISEQTIVAALNAEPISEHSVDIITANPALKSEESSDFVAAESSKEIEKSLVPSPTMIEDRFRLNESVVIGRPGLDSCGTYVDSVKADIETVESPVDDVPTAADVCEPSSSLNVTIDLSCSVSPLNRFILAHDFNTTVEVVESSEIGEAALSSNEKNEAVAITIDETSATTTTVQEMHAITLNETIENRLTSGNVTNDETFNAPPTDGQCDFQSVPNETICLSANNADCDVTFNQEVNNETFAASVYATFDSSPAAVVSSGTPLGRESILVRRDLFATPKGASNFIEPTTTTTTEEAMDVDMDVDMDFESVVVPSDDDCMFRKPSDIVAGDRSSRDDRGCKADFLRMAKETVQPEFDDNEFKSADASEFFIFVLFFLIAFNFFF